MQSKKALKNFLKKQNEIEHQDLSFLKKTWLGSPITLGYVGEKVFSSYCFKLPFFDVSYDPDTKLVIDNYPLKWPKFVYSVDLSGYSERNVSFYSDGYFLFCLIKSWDPLGPRFSYIVKRRKLNSNKIGSLSADKIKRFN